jgi:hypothetical protein
MCQPHHAHDLGKAYLVHSFIDLSDFLALDAPSKGLQNLFEMQRQ